jgi:hypothetical protein
VRGVVARYSKWDETLHMVRGRDDVSFGLCAVIHRGFLAGPGFTLDV